MMKYLMGVDIGTMNVKAVIYDLDGNPVGVSSIPYEIEYFLEPKHPEWAFVNPEQLWNTVISSIHQAISSISDPEDLLAISITGIGMDGLPIDVNGNALYPIISWHCARTQAQCERLVESVGKESIFNLTGRQVLNIDSIYRMMWVKEKLPGIYERTHKWLLIEDYINFRLCGSMVTDYSMASTTSAFDQRKMEWSDEILHVAQIDKRIFPELRCSGTHIGNISNKVAIATGMSTKTKVILGGHDYLCATLSLGAHNQDTIVNITGTWDMIISCIETPMLTKGIFQAGLKVESHVIAKKYAIVGDAVSANMLDWFRHFFPEESKDDAKWNNLLLAAKESDHGAGGIFFLPHCSGAGCPKPDTKSLGAFIGLNDIVTKEHMLRAIIEGLNYQFKDMIMAIESGLNKRASKIIAVGYESKNEFFMQNKADITGKKIMVPEMISASCLGAAIIAGIGVGVYENEACAIDRIKKEYRVYMPRKNIHSSYLKYYEIYKQIYPALQKINGQIFDSFRV